MLIHIVSFKYKPEVTAEERDTHRARLIGLTAIDDVVTLKVGADVVGSARSFDTGLVVTFPGRAALDAYQKDPRHVPVAQYGASLCSQIVAVDFEES